MDVTGAEEVSGLEAGADSRSTLGLITTMLNL